MGFPYIYCRYRGWTIFPDFSSPRSGNRTGHFYVIILKRFAFFVFFLYFLIDCSIKNFVKNIFCFIFYQYLSVNLYYIIHIWIYFVWDRLGAVGRSNTIFVGRILTRDTDYVWIFFSPLRQTMHIVEFHNFITQCLKNKRKLWNGVSCRLHQIPSTYPAMRDKAFFLSDFIHNLYNFSYKNMYILKTFSQNKYKRSCGASRVTIPPQLLLSYHVVFSLTNWDILYYGRWVLLCCFSLFITSINLRLRPHCQMKISKICIEQD